MTDKPQPDKFDWATELSDAQGHVTLSEQEAHEIGARLRASHGQAPAQAAAPAQADEYPALVCDYCGALTPDPWHSSGMLHGKMSKHIHSCDACCRGAAQAAPTAQVDVPESEYRRGYRHGYEQRDAEVRGDAARWRDWSAAMAAASLADEQTPFMRAFEDGILASDGPFSAEQFTAWVDYARAAQEGKP